MLLLRNCCHYHIRKPRVLSESNRSFVNYKASMRQARHQIHLEAADYQNLIEDRYLQQHRQEMRQRHFDNQCSFRAHIFTQSYRMVEQQKKWRQTDDIFTSRQNKFLHDEDVRKINRSRILKIMEHESANYWFNSENVDTRLREESLFPEYIASSEYYYKLFAEALAYELGNFQELDQITSNEQIIKEKNKYLIPLYLQLRSKITSYKRDDAKTEALNNAATVDRIRSSSALSEEQKQGRIAKQQEIYQAKIKLIDEATLTPEGRLKLFKKKVVDLVSIFATWKEYTNVLSLTSAQILKNQSEIKNESSINKVQGKVLASLNSNKEDEYLRSMQEDTEELQISFQEYLSKINETRKQKQLQGEDSNSIEDLDNLLQLSQDMVQESASIDLDSKSPLDLGNLLKDSPEELLNKVQATDKGFDIPQVNSEFLNAKETTSSVQILKQHFREDSEFVSILNQLGELDVRYPRLFQTIWNSIEE